MVNCKIKSGIERDVDLSVLKSIEKMGRSQHIKTLAT